MLDKRLKAAANYVRKNSSCVDVGTDHGYLSVYLQKEGITDKIIACDINEKPLNAARKTIAESGLSEKIRLVLSDGLKNIKSEDADDIIICGMGGELIMNIILDSSYTKDLNKRFILQPMTNIEYLRTALYENGFYIISETPIVDKTHIYTVMNAAYCGEKKQISSLFAVIGRIAESDSPKKLDYLNFQYEKLKKIADGLNSSKEKSSLAEPYYQLVQEIAEIIKELN